MNQYLKRLAICTNCDHQADRQCSLLKEPLATIAKSTPWRCPVPDLSPGSAGSVPVDVVVTCHNYGRYLRECLDSVIAQTMKPESITVVDDGSTDETPEICREYAGHLEALHVRNFDAVRSRRSGMARGTAEFVLFVDADNTLPARYLESAYKAVDSNNVVCVYPDLQRFGDASNLFRTPSCFNRTQLMAANYIDSGSLYRRSALEILDLPEYWQGEEQFGLTSEDYILIQSLARIGGQFRKNPIPLNYRVHAASETAATRPARLAAKYPQTHGIDQQSITLFIPLSGRRWAWRKFSEFLDRQTYDHSRIRLVLCDTSQDWLFSRTVREWLCHCDYPDQRYYQQVVATPGVADQDRKGQRKIEEEVNLAMCRIFNRMRAELSTDYVWILEDDILPPDDVLQRMLDNLAPDVASVFAPYCSRFSENHVCWSQGCPGKRGGGPVHHTRQPESQAQQVEEIRGSGFGCLLIRSGLLKDHLFQIPPDHRYYDPHFFDSLPSHWKRLVDWSLLCEHRSPVD